MTGTTEKKAKLNPADYARFIQQVELVDVRLVAIRAEVKALPEKQVLYTTTCTGGAIFEMREGFFTAFTTYKLRIVDPETKKLIANVSETFAAEYRSQLPMTDEIFTVFSQVNLSLNVWPYLRELTHNTLARMNMPRMVAPTLKLRMESGPKRE
jgi:hypothetical protein